MLITTPSENVQEPSVESRIPRSSLACISAGFCNPILCKSFDLDLSSMQIGEFIVNIEGMFAIKVVPTAPIAIDIKNGRCIVDLKTEQPVDVTSQERLGLSACNKKSMSLLAEAILGKKEEAPPPSTVSTAAADMPPASTAAVPPVLPSRVSAPSPTTDLPLHASSSTDHTGQETVRSQSQKNMTKQMSQQFHGSKTVRSQAPRAAEPTPVILPTHRSTRLSKELPPAAVASAAVAPTSPVELPVASRPRTTPATTSVRQQDVNPVEVRKPRKQRSISLSDLEDSPETSQQVLSYAAVGNDRDATSPTRATSKQLVSPAVADELEMPLRDVQEGNKAAKRIAPKDPRIQELVARMKKVAERDHFENFSGMLKCAKVSLGENFDRYAGLLVDTFLTEGHTIVPSHFLNALIAAYHVHVMDGMDVVGIADYRPGSGFILKTVGDHNQEYGIKLAHNRLRDIITEYRKGGAKMLAKMNEDVRVDSESTVRPTVDWNHVYIVNIDKAKDLNRRFIDAILYAWDKKTTADQYEEKLLDAVNSGEHQASIARVPLTDIPFEGMPQHFALLDIV